MHTLPTTGHWNVDTTATTASFEVSNFVVNRVPGTITVHSGSVRTDERGLPTEVSAVLDAGSIATGNARRDKDLRAPKFLDVAKHPDLRFSGTSVTPAGDGGWTVDGTLSVGTHQSPMRLEVELRRSSRPDTVQVVATGSIDRAAVGIKAPSFVIGRQVQVSIEAVLTPAPARVDV